MIRLLRKIKKEWDSTNNGKPFPGNPRHAWYFVIVVHGVIALMFILEFV